MSMSGVELEDNHVGELLVNNDRIRTKTVFMAGDVVATSSQQFTALLRDQNFGKSVIPEHIVLATQLSEVGITNAERINLLQVVSHNTSNLYTHLWSFRS